MGHIHLPIFTNLEISSKSQICSISLKTVRSDNTGPYGKQNSSCKMEAFISEHAKNPIPVLQTLQSSHSPLSRNSETKMTQCSNSRFNSPSGEIRQDRNSVNYEPKNPTELQTEGIPSECWASRPVRFSNPVHSRMEEHA